MVEVECIYVIRQSFFAGVVGVSVSMLTHDNSLSDNLAKRWICGFIGALYLESVK